MNKYSKIVEEEEDGDEDDYDKEQEEEDKIQFIQNSLKLQQFIMDDIAPLENNVSFGIAQNSSGFQSELQEISSNYTQSQIDKVSLRPQTLRPTSAFQVGTSKFVNKLNDEANKQPNLSIVNDQSSTSSHSIKTPTALQNQKSAKIFSEDVTDRPKTANDIKAVSKYYEGKTSSFQPVYRINQKKVPKETFFAYRSLSPNLHGSKQQSSTLNQNSVMFALSKDQNNCGKQLKKLAQEGILDSEMVQQSEKEKQQLFEIDKKVMNSNHNQDLYKKANQTAPNFYKNEKNEMNKNMVSHFVRKKSDKIIPRQKQISGERSSSLSPPKNMGNKRYLPHRVVQIGNLSDRGYQMINQWQNPTSLSNNKEWRELEIQISPASKIEEKYLKAMKMIEKAYERHDLNPNKKDVQFNNQYITIINYTGQIKTPIDIVDQEYIDCNMYALSYNAYFIPSSKRSLPYYFDLQLHSGDIEVYISKTENPNLDNNDFIFFKFDIPIKINYQRGEVKDGVYLNIFCKQQSSFSFRIMSETGAGNINVGQNTNISQANKNETNFLQEQKSAKNYLTHQYKKQLIQDKASYNEWKLKKAKNTELYVVDEIREGQERLDQFLETRLKEKQKRNIIEDNIHSVRMYSPKERQDHLQKAKNDKDVKIIRALYNKNMNKFQQVNKEILTIQRKAERKVQLTDADGRLESEVRLLKQCFQYRWLQLLVFSAKIKAYKVKLSRNINLTNPIMNLNGLLSGYLKRKLGGDKMQRTFTRTYFCLKTRVKAFKKLMVYNASLVAGEFMQQKIKLMIIQQKMMVYYNHILMIQRSYRKLLLMRDEMNVVNLANWDVAIKIMLEDETKFFDKQWISKPVLVDYKKRLEKNKIKALSHHVKMIQSQFFSKLKQYQAKLRKLPYAYQIAYSFCGKAFHTYFEKQYIKAVKESFQSQVKKTNEYYIETLKFMVKHNIYQLVNNPITAYEKEKQKQLEAQRKKNIELLRQKELQLQKQREEEFMQQKFAKSTKKINVQQTQEDQSGSSASSLDSNGDSKKITESGLNQRKNKGLKDQVKSRQNEKKPTTFLAPPISFQDYVQEEEKKIEELKVRRLSKITMESPTLNEQTNPTKLMEERLKKKIGIKNKFNSSMNSINLDEQGIEDFDNTPRSRQGGSKFSSKKNSVLITDPEQQMSHTKIPYIQLKKRDQSDEINSPRSSNFKKDKSPLKILNKDSISEITTKLKTKQKNPKKAARQGGDVEDTYENENDNQNEEEEDYEYEDNENYHEDIDNYLTKHHSPIKRPNKKQLSIKKSHNGSRGEDDLSRASKSPYSEDQRSKKDENEEIDDFGSKRKIIFELTGQKQQQQLKKNEMKQSKFKSNLKNGNSSSDSNIQSMTSIQQLSQSSISNTANLNNAAGVINLSLNKEISQQSSNATLSNLQDSNLSLLITNKDQPPQTSIPAGLSAINTRSTKSQKQKKKKSKKKKVEIKEEGKLEEIVEGDEATQTFWSNFIHYPIFMSYPNITEMKELIIKLFKKL